MSHYPLEKDWRRGAEGAALLGPQWGVKGPGIHPRRLFKHTTMEIAVAAVLPVGQTAAGAIARLCRDLIKRGVATQIKG